MAVYSNILIAVDFTPATDTVTRQAMDLGRAFKARLSLVHVVEFVPLDLSNDLVLPQEVEIDQELVEMAGRRLQALAENLGVDQSACFVSQGSTRREIIHLAKERDVDLIVIGSHGREGIQRLLGSTANAVLHGAPCDVLAVRIPPLLQGLGYGPGSAPQSVQPTGELRKVPQIAGQVQERTEAPPAPPKRKRPATAGRPRAAAPAKAPAKPPAKKAPARKQSRKAAAKGRK